MKKTCHLPAAKNKRIVNGLNKQPETIATDRHRHQLDTLSFPVVEPATIPQGSKHGKENRIKKYASCSYNCG